MTKIPATLLALNFFVSLFGYQSPEKIDNYLTGLHDKGQLNGNVLVIKDGKTLYENSFGYADGTKTMMLNKDHRFNIGSVYKEFPAVAIMQLQEQNLIHLEDKISKYLTGLPKWSEKVTVKNLLQYSSGLPKIGWGAYFSQGIQVTDSHIYDEIASIEQLEFEPGMDYLYSNINPIVLIKIVEQVSQSSFKDYLQENIFDSFDLNNILLKKQYPYADSTLMAIPFNEDFQEDAYKVAVQSLLFTATTQDMAKWFEQLGDFEVVSKQSVQTLSEEAIVGDNIEAPLGLCDWDNDIITEHSHHGSTANYECVARRFKQDGITIVILTNQKHGNVYEISDEIYNIIKKGS